MIESLNSENKPVYFIIFAVLFIMVLRYIFKLIEMVYVMKYRKPLYLHFYLFKRRLGARQKDILSAKFSFYNKLSQKQKGYFEHRVASFIKDKDFIGGQDMKVTDEMKTLISATAVMLTFGFRDFYIGLISKIVVYPSTFLSKLNNNQEHKGEFSPKMKTLVLSWEDFLKGYNIDNDNLNLGIHEFTHAIHLNSMKERDVSSSIFNDTFKELSKLLSENESLRTALVNSDYFRDYGYTNQFEFLAVAIESFIETPKKFEYQFPEIYQLVKQMLNFRVADY